MINWDEKSRIGLVTVDDVTDDEEIFELMSKLSSDHERLNRFRELFNVLKKTLLDEGCSQRDVVLLGRMLSDGLPDSIEELNRLEDEVNNSWFGK